MKILLCCLLSIVPLQMDPKPASYTGEWVNRTNNEKGTLTVTAYPVDALTWQSTFVGKLGDSPFDYEVTLKVVGGTTNPNQPLQLTGNLEAGGADYILDIWMDHKTLNGDFASASRHGEFKLTRQNP